MLDTIDAARRFVRSFVTRTQRGEGGLAELTAIVALRDDLDRAIDDIARHLLAHDDVSTFEVGTAMGITRQAVAKRYPGASSLRVGGQPARRR